MRRKDREVKDINELLQIIDKCKVCRIGMQDKNGLYIVPMNFEYKYEHNQLVLYFHSAKEGRKIDALKENSNVCFEMDCDHRLITGDEACQYTYSYKSIIGSGKVVFIDDYDEKKLALSVLMRHQTGHEFEFDNKMADRVCVFKIVAQEFTGKHRPYMAQYKIS